MRDKAPEHSPASSQDPSQDPCAWTLHTLSQQLQAKQLSAVEATQACLKRITAQQALGVYLHVDATGALAQAAASDARRQQGTSLGQLDGIPMGIKDNLLTAGLPTTCGSHILENFVAPYDATAVQKLKNAGIVLLGKVSLDAFAMGSSNEHCDFGVVHNVWDKHRVPGGSSGGSANAVAAGLSFGSLGTDTGGSIRQPASFCGCVGLKATYGRVSRYGAIAYASSLDHVGPLGRDVRDCALLLQHIAGADGLDATASTAAVPDYLAQLDAGVAGMRLGVPKEYFAGTLEPEVRRLVEAALQVYAALGAELVEVSLPHTELALAAYYILAAAEASSNLARFDGVRYGRRVDPGSGLLDMYLQTRAQGFGAEVKRRILLGTYVLSAGHIGTYYQHAQQVRHWVQQDFAQAFAQVDALLTPTAPSTAFALGTKVADPLLMYAADACTIPANMAGIPAISLPCGWSTPENLPVGLQVLSKPHAEAQLLRIAYAYEQSCSWQHQRPA